MILVPTILILPSQEGRSISLRDSNTSIIYRHRVRVLMYYINNLNKYPHKLTNNPHWQTNSPHWQTNNQYNHKYIKTLTRTSKPNTTNQWMNRLPCRPLNQDYRRSRNNDTYPPPMSRRIHSTNPSRSHSLNHNSNYRISYTRCRIPHIGHRPSAALINRCGYRMRYTLHSRWANSQTIRTTYRPSITTSTRNIA